MSDAYTLTRTVKLLTIELHGEGVWMVRSLLAPSETLPSEADIRYYYRDLLGMQEYAIIYRERAVPETFQVGLIGSLAMEEPKAWPHMDKVFTNCVDYERYLALIDRVVEIEFLRLNCGVVKEGESKISLADRILVESKVKSAAATKSANKREDWLRAVLESLNAEVEHDEVADIQESDTLAWIFAPIHKDTRHELGYRILTDLAQGMEWGTRVGTALYPDITLCRRISIVNWQMPTEASRRLVHQIMAWYIQSQVLEVQDPHISPWIPNAVQEVDRLFLPFRRIAYGMSSGADAGTGPLPFSVPQLLQKIEDTHIHPNTLEVAVYEPREGEWMQYMYHIVKVATEGMLEFEKCEAFVRGRVQEWMRARRGLRVGGRAFLAKWEPLWEVCMLNRAAGHTGFSVFLDTLDLHDPLRRFQMKETQVRDIGKAWMAIFVEKEIVVDENIQIVAAPLWEIMREWVYQYVPKAHIKEYLRQTPMSKCMTSAGYRQEKKNTEHAIFKKATYRNVIRMEALVSGRFEEIVRRPYKRMTQQWTAVATSASTALVCTAIAEAPSTELVEATPEPVPEAKPELPTYSSSPSMPYLHIEEETIHLGNL